MKRVRGIIIAGLLVGLWFTAEWVIYRRVVPPAEVTSFGAFSEWRPSVQEIPVIRHGNLEYLLA